MFTPRSESPFSELATVGPHVTHMCGLVPSFLLTKFLFSNPDEANHMPIPVLPGFDPVPSPQHAD